MPKLDNLDPAALVNNPRATLPQWVKYSSIVVAAFKQHPLVYEYKPANMSPATVCSRLRDAVRGCLAFQYPCEIPHADLLRWYSEVVVKYSTTTVFIGPPKPVIEQLEAPNQPPAHSYSFDTLSVDELAAFCLLLSTGRLCGPVVVNRAPNIGTLPNYPNIEIMTRPDGALIIL